ncbi:MAG: cation:proton antiporter [Desulfobacterales bacterium]|nr:cation:proton antiporter [Desulfobacterales bacterium]
MDIWPISPEMVLLLGGAFVLGALAQRLRQSPIVGYLLAGTLVGPLLFNTAAVNQAAELGVSLLLFSIGLEFSFKELRRMGKMAFGAGSIQVLATLLVVTLIAAWPMSLPQALTIGAIVTLSSTAIVLRVLVDRADIDSVRGRASLGILLLQDIAVVPLVLMVSFFVPGSVETHAGLHLLRVVSSAAGLAAVFYLVLYRVLPVLLSDQALFANRELTVLLTIAVGLGATWSAHALHISPALGAFVAGLLLGESPFAGQIQADIGSLRIMMVTLFFASIGMLLKPLWFISQLHWILLLAIVIFGLKSAIVFLIARFFGLDGRHALATGITLAQIGEFSFVLLAAARNGGVLSDHAFNLTISVIILLMFAAPYMVTLAFPLSDRLIALLTGRLLVPDRSLSSAETGSVSQVLVVGLGPAGQEVVRSLLAQKIEPLVIDVNPQSRMLGSDLNVKVHLGDAGRDEVLNHAGFKTACMAVVTVPDPDSAVRIVRAIRRLMPLMPIAARCRYHRHLADLEHAGASLIVDEETNVGSLLSQEVLESIRAQSGEAFACRMAGQTAKIV